MLIHSKEIIKKWLLHTNTIPKNLFATNGKITYQFLSYVQNIRNDKVNYTLPQKRQQILIKNMDMLQQIIQNSKKDSRILSTYQKEISLFIQYFSRCIADMNYEELVKTMKMLTKISRFYHQFKRQFLFYFFKSLQKKMKEIIIFNEPPLSLKQISSIIHPFLKAKSTTNVSKDILEYIVTKKLNITGEKPFTKQQLNGYKEMLNIFIPYGIKTTNYMKMEIFSFLQAQNKKNLIPLVGEIILLYLEYNISLSQFPTWVIDFFKKFYMNMQPNNIYDHVLSLYILIKFSKQRLLALDLNLNNLSFIDNVIILNKKIMYLLDNLLPDDESFNSYLNCLNLLQKLYVKHIFHIKLINKQIKAMNRKQDIICVLTINLKIVKLAKFFEKNMKINYQLTRDCLFPYMKIISFQFDKLMQIQNVSSLVFELLMSFVQLSYQKQRQLINYLRPIQFLVVLQPYITQKQNKKFVDFLKTIEKEANLQTQRSKLQIFQLIRLRLVLFHMKIQLDPQCKLEKVYKNAKRNHLQTVFENLDRTRLRELNLPEMIQICKDLAKGKNEYNSFEDGLSWSILISAIQPQQMLIFWRPFIKKNIKNHKFLVFINACISEENFELSALELQLLSQVYLQCQQRDVHNRFNIEKLLKFSHPYEILHQFWQFNIHNIKPIFLLYHVFQTHKFFQTQQVPANLFDFVKKQLFILYNIMHLPEYEFTIEESFATFNYFIQKKLAQYKQLEISTVGLYRDLFIWITANNLNSMLIQDLKSTPLKLINLSKYLKNVIASDCKNPYDKLCLIKFVESLPINQRQKSKQKINLYITENEEIKKLYDLASKQLSEEEFQKYSTDELIKFITRGITSPNLDLMYSRFFKDIEKQQTYSIDTLNTIAKTIYLKFNRGHCITKNQRKLALQLGNYYKKQFLLQELPFHSQYIFSILFLINNKSLPVEFPIDKFISTNKFTIIQLAPIINHYNIQIKQQRMSQLLKYLSFSRFFQFYFATEIQLITKNGINKLVQLLHFNLFNNLKTEFMTKLIQLNLKDLKKFNPQMCNYLSKKLAIWLHITKTLDDHKLQDMLFGINEIFHKQSIFTEIKRIIDKSNKKQNMFIEKIQQQHQLTHMKTQIQIDGVDIQLYAYKNKKQELVLIRQKQQLIDQIKPSGQDLLLGKFIQIKLNAKVSFLGYCLQSM